MALKYYSTNLQSPPVSFPEALLRGQAPDKGLYMPVVVPTIRPEELDEFPRLAYHEIALRVMWKYLQDQIPYQVLQGLTEDAYSFTLPLEKIVDRQYVLRLDQGPTASFKDFAARAMARLMNYYLQQQQKELIILTATSGDTGSAIAHAFLGLDRIRVIVLFPRDEVSPRQRKQMTTLGQNIEVLSLDGKFDDCQAIVKQAFADPELAHLALSSANSINIGRLIPQTVYYFYAYSRLARENEKIIFSVPSGNFGDMMGGLLAMKMGLPVSKFVVAVNENDAYPVFLNSGFYQKIEPSRNCISSAMNVGHPSNLARLAALYKGVMDEKGFIHRPANMQEMRDEIWSVSVSDTATRDCIRETWSTHRVLLEPHGAVGWAAWLRYRKENPGIDDQQLAVCLETAHPAKFPDEIRQLLGFDPPLPPSLEGLEQKPERYQTLETAYPAFKEFLLLHYTR